MPQEAHRRALFGKRRRRTVFRSAGKVCELKCVILDYIPSANAGSFIVDEKFGETQNGGDPKGGAGILKVVGKKWCKKSRLFGCEKTCSQYVVNRGLFQELETALNRPGYGLSNSVPRPWNRHRCRSNH